MSTDADDWRGRDWRVGDRVEVHRRRARSMVGYLIQVSRTEVWIWDTEGMPSHYVIYADDIASMVRLVPEQPQPAPTPDLQRRIESLEREAAQHQEQIKLQRQDIACLYEHLRAATHRSPARDAQVADLLKRVTELETNRVADRVATEELESQRRETRHEEAAALHNRLDAALDSFESLATRVVRLENQSVGLIGMLNLPPNVTLVGSSEPNS